MLINCIIIKGIRNPTQRCTFSICYVLSTQNYPADNLETRLPGKKRGNPTPESCRRQKQSVGPRAGGKGLLIYSCIWMISTGTSWKPEQDGELRGLYQEIQMTGLWQMVGIFTCSTTFSSSTLSVSVWDTKHSSFRDFWWWYLCNKYLSRP